MTPLKPLSQLLYTPPLPDASLQRSLSFPLYILLCVPLSFLLITDGSPTPLHFVVPPFVPPPRPQLSSGALLFPYHSSFLFDAQNGLTVFFFLSCASKVVCHQKSKGASERSIVMSKTCRSISISILHTFHRPSPPPCPSSSPLPPRTLTRFGPLKPTHQPPGRMPLLPRSLFALLDRPLAGFQSGFLCEFEGCWRGFEMFCWRRSEKIGEE